MMAQGWWAFDVTTLMATYLGHVTQQAQVILELLATINYMVPIAMDIAGAILVGNAVGAGSEQLVKHYFKWSMYVGLFISTCSAIILITLREQIVSYFTDDIEVMQAIYNCWPVFCVFSFFDIMAAISGSAIWASGLMKLGTIVTAIANWPIGIMVAGLLAFKFDFGISGLWTGPTIAWIIICVSFTVTV
jgi:multidrug resistance protein, MATE family